MPSIKRIGVLTGGGDAPGLNAVIRAVVKAAFNAGIEVVGLEDSFDGLLDPSRSRILTPKDVTGILRLGGTILGTTNHGNPFEYPVDTPEGKVDYSDRVVETFHKMGLQALVVIGGDGSLQHRAPVLSEGHSGRRRAEDDRQRHRRARRAVSVSIRRSSFAADAIDRLHTTAEAHKRIMVVEVMGRYAGWIALQAGIAGGADVILMPEIPYDPEKVAAAIRKRESLRREVQHRRRRRRRQADRRQLSRFAKRRARATSSGSAASASSSPSSSRR